MLQTDVGHGHAVAAVVGLAVAPSDRRVLSQWTSAMLGAYIGVALILISLALFHFGASTEGPAQSQSSVGGMPAPALFLAFGRRVTLSPSCIAWDNAARAAIAMQAQKGARTGDANFRIQRARRNCDAGWRDLACADYQSVLNGPPPPGDAKWHRLDPSRPCGLAIADNE